MNKDLILNEFGRVAEAIGRDFENSPKSLASTLAVEAGKVLENFQWMSELDSELIDDPVKRKAIAADIADLMIYATVLCHKLDMDPWAVIKDKLLQNRERHIERHASTNSVDVQLTNSNAEWNTIAKRIASSRELLRDSASRVKQKAGSE